MVLAEFFRRMGTVLAQMPNMIERQRGHANSEWKFAEESDGQVVEASNFERARKIENVFGSVSKLLSTFFEGAPRSSVRLPQYCQRLPPVSKEFMCHAKPALLRSMLAAAERLVLVESSAKIPARDLHAASDVCGRTEGRMVSAWSQRSVRRHQLTIAGNGRASKVGACARGIKRLNLKQEGCATR